MPPAAFRTGEVFLNPALTVDGVVIARPGDGSLRVLLVERGRQPFRGRHALPGGFVERDEDPADAVARELAEETGLAGLDLRQFRAYGAPGRDPRGHTVSLVWVAELEGAPPPVAGGDDAAAAGWHPVDALPNLAFDHAEIIADVLAAARGDGGVSPRRPNQPR